MTRPPVPPPENGTEDDPTRLGQPLPPEDRTRLAGLPEKGVAEQGLPEEGAEQRPSQDEATRLADAPAAEDHGQTDLKIGTLINNNYRVTAELKAGGMGSVYRGIEVGTGDPVAIKVVLSALAEHEQSVMLFRREARTLRQLTHPAIVRYYNYVQDPQLDRYFLVMEYIDGIALSDYVVMRGTLGSDAALTLLERLAGGLGSAHALGVIHRDLSPDNVMLPDGDIAQARLIDFGIARSTINSDRQLDNQFAGKLKYVAPEQLGMYGGDAGPRADIYGLALLLIAAMLGKPLQMGATIEEAVERRGAVPDISAVPLRLQPLLRRMLAPDPAERPASMEALLAEIAALRAPVQTMVEGLTLPPRPDAPLSDPVADSGSNDGLAPKAAPRPRRRDPLPRRLVLVMAAVFAGVIGFAGWQSGWFEPAPAAVDEATQGLAPRDTSSRDGFLASLPAPECFYAHRVTSGPRTGVISVISQSASPPVPELVAEYAKAFGAAPERFDMQASAAQCPVLDLAHEMAGRAGPALSVAALRDEIASGETVRATFQADPQAQKWVGLVTPEGRIYNLGSRLQGQDLAFALSAPEGAGAQTQLVLAIASDQALVSLATLADGADAADMSAALLAEAKETGQKISVAVVPIRLSAPAATSEDSRE